MTLRSADTWGDDDSDVLWYRLGECQGLGSRPEYPDAEAWCEVPDPDLDPALVRKALACLERAEGRRTLSAEYVERFPDDAAARGALEIAVEILGEDES